MIKSSRSVGLQLLTHSNNLLKMPTWEVGYRSKTFRKELIEVRNIASGKGLCSLSANQVGCYSSFFVVLGRNRLIANKWTGYKAGTSDYEVVVNPKIEKRSQEVVNATEECPSLPGLQFKVDRFGVIQATWKDEQMKDQSAEISGFLARVWQHQIHHLNGKILIDEAVCKGNLFAKPGFKDLTKGQFERMKEDYLKLARQEPQNVAELNRRWAHLVQLAKYGIMQPCDN